MPRQGLLHDPESLGQYVLMDYLNKKVRKVH